MLVKVAYVSGKYTDPRGPCFAEMNITKAAEIAMQLWSLGIATICPHTNTKHFDGATDYETFLYGDLAMVDRCDLLVMVDNWKTSKGATSEREHALKCGVPAFEWPEEICHIVRFCWPAGVPAKYIESSKHLLPRDLHVRITESLCWPPTTTPASSS